MGRYSNLGRFIGALDALALAALGAYTLVTPTAGGAQAATGLSIYTICVSPLLFVVEMPTLCKCFKFCNVLTRYTKWIAGTWILRSVLYILIAAGAFAIYVNAPKEQNFILAIVHAGVLAAAGAYLLATFMREDAPDGSANPALAAAQSGAEKSASRFGGFFARTAVKTAQENPQAAAAVAGAAAPSLANQLFGGSSSSAAAAPASSDPERGGAGNNHGFNGSGFNSVAPASGGGLESFKPGGNSAPKGFYDDDDAPSASMFSGNGGYGGTSGAGGSGGSPQPAPVKDSAAVSQSKQAKYGVSQAGALGAPLTGGDDLPEDNPFAH